MKRNSLIQQAVERFAWCLQYRAVAAVFIALCIFYLPTYPQVFNTIAGNGAIGYSGDGGQAVNASFNNPQGIALDSAGNLYISDNQNYTIRKINAQTGVITTVAGNGFSGSSGDGGPATQAQLASPVGICVDAAGNIFFADQSNHKIRKVNAITGIITTIAGIGTPGYNGDGITATSAKLNSPQGVALDLAGNIYIGDASNFRVRKIIVATGFIYTIAGNGLPFSAGDGGLAISARFRDPRRVSVDSSGNVYILDRTTQSHIRRIDAATGIINSVAGGGTNTADTGAANTLDLMPFSTDGFGTDVAVDPTGGFIVSSGWQAWKVVNGSYSRIAGTGLQGFSGDGGDPLLAVFNNISGVAVSACGNVFLSDRSNQRIRKIDYGMTLNYLDADLDGYGAAGTQPFCSVAGPGNSTNNTDCNDNNAAIHSPISYFIDADHDGFGSTNTGLVCATSPPTGYSTNNTDCNDGNVNIYPSAAEICNHIDDNCNGLTDDADPLITGQPTWYSDSDGDGYGDPAQSLVACYSPAGYTSAIPFKRNQLSRVLATSGGFFTGGGTTLSWTYGQNVNLTLQGANTLITQGFQQPYVLLKLLNLKAFFEGFYTGGGLMQAVLYNNDPVLFPSNYCDSIIVMLHEANAPYNIVASKQTVLLTNGTALVQFAGSLINGSYYIVLQHRNSIETWSKMPVTFGSNTSFDFTAP